MAAQTGWHELVEWIGVNHPNYDKFGPPVSSASLTQFQEVTGFSLPVQLAAVYAETDGSAGDFFCIDFLPLDEVIRQWQTWAGVRDDLGVDGMEGMRSTATSTPDGAIKLDYSNPKWIPIFHDLRGNHLGVDLDPDTEGTVGQVITFGRDEDHKVVVASNIDDLAQTLLKQLRAGNYDLDDQGMCAVAGKESLIDTMTSLAAAGSGG